MQSGQSSSARATESGLHKIREAKDYQRSNEGERLTYERLAEKAYTSVSTVKRFFKGEEIYRDNALAITQVLGLQLEDVVEYSELDSTFYVERPPIEFECCTVIEKPGALIRIKAPQQMGKTLLLEKILAHARQQDYQTVIVSFETDSTVFNDLEKFSRWFCASVGKRLELPNKLADSWDDIYGCNDNITDYFEEYLLAELTNPLVLALERVDRVFEHSAIANDFCALLRGWNDKAKQSDKSGAIWKKLRLVVVHSTEVYGSLDINRSPLANVGKIFPLPEFTSEQVQDLARRYELDWVGTQEVELLMAMVGGHPYLIQQAFDYLERQNVTLSEFLQIAPTEESPFSAHLRQHLWNLQQNSELSTAFGEVVTSNQAVRIETAQAFKLHSMGLVQLQGNDCNPRCDLYRQYFSVRLAAA
ncbi:MAG TPA: AAA-like domain-containing protein [Coleofasciculaceae cyanobacterium]|jgi:hypothetical protein